MTKKKNKEDAEVQLYGLPLLYKQSNLEVFIVSYGRSKPEVRQLIKSLEQPATN